MKFRKISTVALFIIICFATSGDAASIKSKLFYGSGTCTGNDQVTIQQPWESSSITIVGVEISFFQWPSGGVQYAFAGNSYTPDIMMFVGYGNSHGANFFPAGSGMAFSADPTYHVDLHVSCPSGSWQAYEIIYYTIP